MRKVETFFRKPVRFCEKLVRFLFCVEEAFDRTLRRFLKLLFVESEADDLFVGIDHGVDHAAVFFHLAVEGVLIQAGFFDFLVVGVDEGVEFVAFLDDYALQHVGQCVELVFDLLGVDVLSARAEQHILATATNEEIARFVDHTEVACVVPSLGIECGRGGFRIFVVAEHHVGAARENFAHNVLRIGTVYAQFHAGNHLTARTRYEFFPVFVGDERSAFRGAVAHSNS